MNNDEFDKEMQKILGEVLEPEKLKPSRLEIATTILAGIVANNKMLIRFDNYGEEIFGSKHEEMNLNERCATAALGYADALIKLEKETNER